LIFSPSSGCNWGEKLETYPDSAWDKVMNLNVKGVFNLTKFFVPALEKKSSQSGNPSSVIMIGSIDGIRTPILENYAYSASKAALHHLTKVLANKLSYKNITVNCIAPGPFESKMMAETLKKFQKQIVSGVPLARIGSEQDIIGTCIFLSSKASYWMTGNIIQLDGGILIKSGF
jgi:NAD(P)-dependent dehydrogenase (short-subunit alcohol dehydrogenase family)